MKTLTVTLICKDEEENLRRLLPTLTFADEIVVVDTGSTDGSVQIAKIYTDKVYFFAWRDDFSAARNYAIEKSCSDYVMWLDADDCVPVKTINSVLNWKNDSAENADFYYLKYRMGYNSDFWFWRERIIKRCKKCRFKGFIHEAVVPFGFTKRFDGEVIHTSSQNHASRNLNVYRKAIENKKKFSPRDKYYYARTLIENGMNNEALPVLRKFCYCKNAFSVDKAEAYKLIAKYYLSKLNVNIALKYLSKSVSVLLPDAETRCLLGDCFYVNNDCASAAEWYEFALTSKVQRGFVNDYFKAFYPLVQLSVCYFRMGETDKAKTFHLAAKSISPDNPAVLSNDKWFVT